MNVLLSEVRWQNEVRIVGRLVSEVRRIYLFGKFDEGEESLKDFFWK